ncbi:hypothetical protein [Calothrix sp. 336/3]|uniref:hypothetical protein n=1 Tax=Calothrix sp. 336/3 TaxID=1337936 RepID=UPI00069C0FCD|nr:hypothetical protein [Calothrix sp. 336/3]
MVKSGLKSAIMTPTVRRFLRKVGIKRPEVPEDNGMKAYFKDSLWQLNVNCPCDVHFNEYIQQNNIHGKSIFHFGTGEHHIIGLENQKLEQKNEILAITASAPEHKSYVDFVIEDESLGKYYKVLFADIYTLTANTIPNFDIINLFHLCEFYVESRAHLLNQNDESLLQLFLDKLNPQGKILFYSGSFRWDRAEKIVASFVTNGKIRPVGEFKTLLIYEKCV